MEKKILIVVGAIVALFLIMVLSNGKAGPFLILGGIGYLMYKNNR